MVRIGRVITRVRFDEVSSLKSLEKTGGAEFGISFSEVKRFCSPTVWEQHRTFWKLSWRRGSHLRDQTGHDAPSFARAVLPKRADWCGIERLVLRIWEHPADESGSSTGRRSGPARRRAAHRINKASPTKPRSPPS